MLPIKLQDRPQYKDILEQLSPLIGTGNTKSLLNQFSCLHDIAQSTEEELLQAAPKLDKVKLRRLKSAFLLASSLLRDSVPPAQVLDTPRAVVDLVRENFRFEKREMMIALNLDGSRKLLTHSIIAYGGDDYVSVKPKQIFAPAIKDGAAFVALVHNHPTGETKPSVGDLQATDHFIRAGRILGIKLADHIIVGPPTKGGSQDYCSIRYSYNLDFE